jgi:hypothetical protein
MVKAMIDIDENANRILNIVKAKFGLKDKSQAINMMAKEYGQVVLEPELRPELKAKPAKTDAKQTRLAEPREMRQQSKDELEEITG